MATVPTTGAGAATSSGFAQGMQGLGLVTSIIGMGTQALGAYYGAKSAQVQLESQASTLKFQAELSEINATMSELQAQQILRAGQRQMMVAGLKAGATKSQSKASMAARGIDLGVGSAVEVQATTDLMKEIDLLTINANAVRAAEAERMRKVGIEQSGMMQQVSAQNMQASAGTISPFMNFTTSLLGGAGSVASQYYNIKART